MFSPHAIVALMQQRGGLAYEGEGVTQLQHGWQCARLARQAQAPAPLELAAWLHDIGHLMTGLPGSPTLTGVDDAHEAAGGGLLGRLFGPAVGEPVALHVAAKRCLVFVRPGYQRSLSADSLRSLALQGGPMAASECAVFMKQPQAREAMRLRVWDDLAKDAVRHPASNDQALAELTALMARVLARCG